MFKKMTIGFVLGLMGTGFAYPIETHCLCVYSKTSEAQPTKAELSTVEIQDLVGIYPDEDGANRKIFMTTFAAQCHEQGNNTLVAMGNKETVIGMMGCQPIFKILK